MADKNEPGGAVPSALAAIRRATKDDAVGVAIYIVASLMIATAVAAIIILS